jgi:hypothetical protein
MCTAFPQAASARSVAVRRNPCVSVAELVAGAFSLMVGGR